MGHPPDADHLQARVVAVCRNSEHTFSKASVDAISLLPGLGVEGDAHQGVTVQHLSRIRQNPAQPNLRQVHLIHEELHDELRSSGFLVTPGAMGENITTRGIDLLALPVGTKLHIGKSVILTITGLRNPCAQLDNFQPGLMAAVLDRDAGGKLIRKAGVMAIVLAGGDICPGDVIDPVLPPPPHRPLEPV